MFHVLVLFCLCWWRIIGVFGVDEVKSAMEGESVTLNSAVTKISEDEDILWKFGRESSLIAEISRTARIFSIYDNVTDGRFKDRLKLDNKTGSLTITNITTQHAGRYEQQLSGAKLSSKTFRILVYAHLPVPLIFRNSSQCSSDCSVVCSVVNVSAVSLSWYKGNSLLSSINVSDLSINPSLPLEVEHQENNTYSCVINNTISNHTTHLDINTLCQPCEDPPLPVSLLISAVVGFLLLASAVGIFWICMKHKKRNQSSEIHSKEITYAEPVFKKRHAQKSKAKEEDHIVYAPVIVRR